MVNYMEELSVTEADNLKKTIAALFRQTCILQMKYDPVTLVPRDNLHYEICTRHRKFIEDYLSVLSCELVHDPQEHIYRLHGDGIAIEKINATVTKVILLVKLIYRDKILGEGLKATVTNLAEIREYGKNTNLINYKLTMGEWKEALYVMSKHQIIEVPGAIQNVEDETPIYIYSTINLYCGSMDITALIKEYQEDQYAGEEITEELFEGYLDTHGIPDPDLLIRTSGELRLSNYLLWQLAYTEFYFTDVLWPDFDKEELIRAVEYYNTRDRRFGGV